MDDAVGAFRKGVVMGDDHESLAQFVAQGKKEIVQFVAVTGIEVSGGFIGHDHRRFVDQGTGHGHPLFLTS